jgi:hypothetical protein
LTALIETQVKEYLASGVRYSDPAAVMAQFFAGAVLGVIACWLEHVQPMSAEQLAQFLDHLLNKQNEGRGEG